MSAAFFVSCADDKATECGAGDAVDIDGTTYCVFEQAVVVENGFECPPDVPFLTPAMGFGVCGKSGEVPIDLLDDILQQWQSDRGTCTLNAECAADKSCVANVCQNQTPNNSTNNTTNNTTNNSTNNTTNNSTNNTTNNSTNNPVCGSDDECAVGQSCVSGACVVPCGGFIGLQCSDTEWCNYGGLDGMCGAADQSGTCEPRPEVCTADVAEVCGCDGVTYGNLCKANAAGADVITLGPCL